MAPSLPSGGTTPPDPPAPGGNPSPQTPLAPSEWQVLFDGGHQQRYLPDRQAVLRYVLAVGPRAASPRFEVLTETGRVRLADGTDGGRQFALVEVIDLARPGELDRLRQELDGSAEPS
jgi:hypothetical protein